MWNKLLRFIRSLFTSVAVVNVITETKKDAAPASETVEEKHEEAVYFAKANNIADEFIAEPLKIHNSNMNSDEVIGYQTPDGKIVYNEDHSEPDATSYKGYMIFYYNKTEMEHKKKRIDAGFTGEFMTIKEYFIREEVNAMGREEFEDDVDKLEGKLDKPTYQAKNTEYATGVDPYGKEDQPGMDKQSIKMVILDLSKK